MRKVIVSILPLLFITVFAVAQSKVISGAVTDAKDNSPLAGVSVTIKGGVGGVQTDASGKFSITVPETARTLVFSFVGFEGKEVAIRNQSAIDVSLTSDEKRLQEVVVVGYGTQRRRDVTANISVIGGDRVKNAPVQSFDQALGGKAAGLSITQPNGVLNNPPVIRIRGAASITGSSYPLIVVDGVTIFTGDIATNHVVNNPLGDINPADIEEITVLKDAAATAIYGSRAAPGVLVITTKKGRGTKPRVNYDTWIGWSRPFRLPDVLNAQEYILIKNEARANVGLAPAYFMDTINGVPVDTDWSDYVYRQGFSQNHSLSAAGSTGTGGRYYMSVGYSKQDGIFINNNFERKQARLNVDQKVNTWLNISGGMNYTKSLTESPSTGSTPQAAFNTAGGARVAFVTAPVASPYKADGSYNLLLPLTQNQVGLNKSTDRTGFYNPVVLNDLNRITSGNDHIQGNISAEIKLFKGLTFKTLYGADYITVENKSFYNPIHGDGLQQSGTQDDGTAFNDIGKYSQTTWQNYFSFDREFAGEHSVSATVGTEQIRSYTDRWAAKRSGVTDPFYSNIQGGFNTWDNPPASSATTLIPLVTENYLLSYFGRVSYDFSKRYFVSGTFRRDAYSPYSPGDISRKWGNFPGVSVGWQISNEKFYEKSGIPRVLNNLKLRASYGKVGNTNIADFGALSTFSSNNLYGTYSTLYYSQAGNRNLKWEDNFKTDVGLSFGLWNDRLSGEVSYYKNKYEDVIIFVPTPPSLGIPGNSILQNTAEMYNKGIEVALNANVISNKDLTWSVGVNITTMKNEVTKLATGVNDIVGFTGTQNGANERANITRKGYSIASIYTVRTLGVNPSNGQRIFLDAAGRKVQYDHSKPAASRYTYVDGGGIAPTIDLAADGKVIGPSLPTWFGGFQTSLNWNNFDVGFDLIFSGGNYIYNGSKAGLRDQRFWNNHTDVLERWQKPGDLTNIPKLIWNDNISNGSGIQISENVEKGDFVKAKSIVIGYTLSKNVTSLIGLQSIRFYSQLQNAFVVTNYTGSDPEVASNGNNAIGTGSISPGVDRNTAPQARTLVFGLNIIF
ncbi:MAG TPA: TonB-dependent receptor [Flavitalea sp.]|nr:TonB-dependent receptor [Flavitalea sp.]